MVLQHKENFASWDNLTAVESSANAINDNSDPLDILSPRVGGGASNAFVHTSSLPSVFVGTKTFIYMMVLIICILVLK